MLKVKGVYKEFILVIRSVTPRGSDKATKIALGNDLIVQLTCILYPANNMTLH
jgi:hypothetical protein